MVHSTLTPVFVGLRTGLHVLFATLLALVVVRVAVVGGPWALPSLVLAAAFGAVYLLGARIARAAEGRRSRAGVLWLVGLTVLWTALLVLVPEAAYLVFPLFFLYLHVLPRVVGPVAVVLATAVAISAIGVHGGFTVGGVVGPVVGAGVALLIGLGYRALAREAAEREELVAELLATRDRLAATEREQGVLAERARLAREIHDTVAQGLSSIQMLLHAAERADGDRPGAEHVRLARETAADGLADTRRFIRELAPPTLEAGLPAALRRLAATQWSADGVTVAVDAPETVALPMDLQTALLRIAQGAVANVVQHAGAARVRLVLAVDGREARLTVTDDGRGFDVVAVDGRARSTDSFGLRAMADRVAQFGGRLEVDSSPGSGTTVVATLEVP
ncbi:signal transduction histidine kinase [Curtobacterium luteum]|uniref:Signal transduction histidine kinase n=1 Tax=Curtobacterium luteum TaxID=33881 RepID=A0A8H9GA55_9MICO|nr:sensor histidine kinase [Curtobacterium luteum]MBM7802506.1 signal transduction histidine kinase [Curtobacterium luteum]NUU50431.1 sensor histidine kinase [Curtobacterium luteum]GGL07372.1 two-component sensor histidine kinase [Curtobacterium luteum]